MITTTSLVNPHTLRKIVNACRKVRDGHCVAHVRNKKDQAFLAVRLREGQLKGRMYYEITDKKGRNLAYQVQCAFHRNNIYRGWVDVIGQPFQMKNAIKDY